MEDDTPKPITGKISKLRASTQLGARTEACHSEKTQGKGGGGKGGNNRFHLMLSISYNQM